MESVSFSGWITRKYIEWRANKIGREGSVSAFARLFGVPQSLMVDWMKEGGKVPSSAKYISALAAYFGPEAYSALGIEEPEKMIDILPETYRSRVQAAIDELRKELLTKGVSRDDPKAECIARCVFARYGITLPGEHDS